MNLLWRAYIVALTALWAIGSLAQRAPTEPTNSAPTVVYKEDQKPEGPWSIHIVRAPRHSALIDIQSTRGSRRNSGLGTVSDQASALNQAGTPLAAINGDFYQRQGLYSGNPRGLQIIQGEITSAPAGTPTFWIDTSGEPHIEPTTSQMQVVWPNGTRRPIGLNDARRANAIVLYTAAVGASTRTRGGRELILERAGESWLPLRPGKVYRSRVSEVRTAGNSPLTLDTLVLSIGPGLVPSCPTFTNGMELQISTATTPALPEAKTAISGGPVLVRAGKAQRFRATDADSFEIGSAMERHPRSAMGWNDDNFFLVEVDGRQRRSVGMTLSELAVYMAKLGCTEAMNLDGGGSSTLWYSGRVRNRPCDGEERLVGNALVVIRKVGKNSSAARDEIEPAASASP